MVEKEETKMMETLWIVFLLSGSVAFNFITLFFVALITIMIIEEVKILKDRN